MISQNMNPESSTTGKFGACWHLFHREQELTEFQPPEFLGRGIVYRAFFSVFLIPIAHQITQQQNRNQLQKGHSYLEFTTTKELYLIFSLPCRKKLNFLEYSTMSPLSQALSLVYQVVYHSGSRSDLTEELCKLQVKVGGLKSV